MNHRAQHNGGIFIEKRLARLLSHGDPFEACMRLDGEVVRQAPGRRTFRFAMNGSAYFAKVHTGVGWREIAKNLFYARLPVLGAANEWRAIDRVKSLGVRTTEPAAFGERGWNPAARRSFLITHAIENTLSLEDLAQQWKPDHRLLKRMLINDVARIARTLHENGINHRDFYLCHFRIEEEAIRCPARFVGLILMDLHRAQLRSRTPCRWRIKDLAGLLFSAMDAPITQRDVLRFVRHYEGRSLREALSKNRAIWKAVMTKAARMYRDHHERQPRVRLA